MLEIIERNLSVGKLAASLNAISRVLNRLLETKTPWAKIKGNGTTVLDGEGPESDSYHTGKVVVGVHELRSKDAQLEVVGSVAFGAGNHAVVGGNNAILSGENNSVRGTNNGVGGRENKALGLQNVVNGGLRNSTSSVNTGIVAGANNSVTGQGSVIGGGDGNQVTQGDGFIGAGYKNQVSGPRGFIGAGFQNKTRGESAVVAGGNGNEAAGHYSAIPGGIDNQVSGYAAFAAGRKSKALHDGAFVWSGSDNSEWVSANDDEFAALAAGGFRFRSSILASTGVDLPSNASSWVSASPAALQVEAITPDKALILAALSQLPVSIYRNTAFRRIPVTGEVVEDGVSQLNIGPTAEAWNGAFADLLGEKHLLSVALGENGEQLLMKTPGISQGDQLGIALVAIQELYALVQGQAQRISLLEGTLNADPSAPE